MLNSQGQSPPFPSPILPLLQHSQAHWKSRSIAQLLRESNGNLRLPKAMVAAMKTLIGHGPM